MLVERHYPSYQRGYMKQRLGEEKITSAFWIGIKTQIIKKKINRQKMI